MYSFMRTCIFNPFDKYLLTESKFARNFGIWSISLMHFIPNVSCFNSNNNGPHFDGFGHGIIIQTRCLQKLPLRCQMPSYAKSYFWWLLNPWSNCKCSSSAFHIAMQMRICLCFAFFLIAKLHNIVWFTAIETRPYALLRSWIVCFYFDATPSPRLRFRTSSLCALSPCASNTPLLTPSSTSSSASSPRQWSNTHMRPANS